MSLYDRSAQFSSYKALSGYEDMVAEEARIVGERIVLEGHELDLLNQKLELIADVIRDGHIPELSITYFVPDAKKEGGKYVTVTGKIKRWTQSSARFNWTAATGRSVGKRLILVRFLPSPATWWITWPNRQSLFFFPSCDCFVTVGRPFCGRYGYMPRFIGFIQRR